MDIQISSSRKPRKLIPKISLQEYLDFIATHDSDRRSMTFLKEVLAMNGFSRNHRLQKAAIVDVTKTLDLMDPCRSTLKENISPNISLGLDEAMKDIRDLDWQECCITSILTVKSSPNTQEPVADKSSKKIQKPKSPPEIHADNTSSSASVDLDERMGFTKPVRKIEERAQTFPQQFCKRNKKIKE